MAIFILFLFFVETSDHSDIESRVRRLRDQLEVRKREVKRLYNERKKQRKAMLRAQEASLRQELQVNTRVNGYCNVIRVHVFTCSWSRALLDVRVKSN